MTSSSAGPGRVLVVGASGLVGRAVCQRLLAAGAEVFGTSRKAAGNARSMLRLDLAAPDVAWRELPPVDAIILCAAQTGFAACRQDPTAAELVNVHRTSALAEYGIDNGAFVLFVSSNAVFDGTQPFVRRNAAVTPTTEYGRQKAETERRILALGRRAAIVRLSKVLDPSSSLMQGWRRRLMQGERITAFSDMTLAPLTPGFVAELMLRIVTARGAGIYQASGDADLTYAHLAQTLCQAMQVDSNRVVETSAPAGVGPEVQLAYSTLDMSREQTEFGMLQPGSAGTMHEIAVAVTRAPVEELRPI